MTKESIWNWFRLFIHLSIVIDMLIWSAGAVQVLLYAWGFIDATWLVLLAPLIIITASVIVKFILLAAMIVLLPRLPLKDE